MTDQLLIALAQLDPTVGGIVGNTAKIIAARRQAKNRGAHLVVTTEHSVLGYSPEDLVKKPDVLAECRDAYNYLAEDTQNGGPGLIVGGPWQDNEFGVIYNAALHIEGGIIKQVIKKHDLPNYGVFDDKRLFAAGGLPDPIIVNGVPVGLMVCEDTWFPDVAAALVEKGAQLLISINGSPYEYNKEKTSRMGVLRARVNETHLPIIYVNQVGGQDGVVYDGHSLALNRDGRIAWRAPGWQEHVGFIDCVRKGTGWQVRGPQADWGTGLEQLYSALVLGVRDYVRKNGFEKVIIGISGGADSALVAAIACDALGPENVLGVRLPSEHTSEDSMVDAEDLSRCLKFKLINIPIIESAKVVGFTLTTCLGEELKDVTGQNLQARLRGLLLMAITNQFPRHMLLTTGNKSEMAVGYATLYGDMCGGFNALKDVYKTSVFKLMEWRNNHKPGFGLGPEGIVIPENIICKPPSAELKPGQTDEGELGSYALLDALLEQLIEKETPIAEIISQGFAREYIAKISELLDVSQFKRQQAAPGVKVSSRALFGDRRYPVTNAFRSSQRLGPSFAERVGQLAS
jgi:NAD+ synthase